MVCLAKCVRKVRGRGNAVHADKGEVVVLHDDTWEVWTLNGTPLVDFKHWYKHEDKARIELVGRFPYYYVVFKE